MTITGDKLMQIQSTSMSVADFLDNMADQARAEGLDNNAEIYGERALQAKQQEIAYQRLQQLVGDLQARLDDIARTARPVAHA